MNKDISPFDPSRFKVTNRPSEDVGVKESITSVKVCKPEKQQFIRVHADEQFHFETAVLELKDDKEVYLVLPSLVSSLAGELSYVKIHVAITKHGQIFLWPVKISQDDARKNSWNESALSAVEIAKKKWVRIISNMQRGEYVTLEAQSDFEPNWPPDLDLEKLLSVAFRSRVIESLDHPVLKRLAGER